VLVYHNTFVSPKLALNLQTPITQHNFIVSNNLFVGPETLAGNRTVEWTAALDEGKFDFNGYYPDGGFWLGVVGGQNVLADSFAELKAGGTFEQNGVLLTQSIFASGNVGPTGDGSTAATPFDVTLADGSNAIDVGTALAGINAGHLGGGPDLGALEKGCPTPTYGPRPEGQEGVTNAIDCNASTTPPGDGGVGGSGGTGAGGSGNGGSGTGGSGASSGSSGNSAGSSDDDGGCGCRAAGNDDAWGTLVLGLVGLGLLGRRTQRRRR
jgi:MYXO-CTERM domain-containing protein